jgi:hypothetical protein
MTSSEALHFINSASDYCEEFEPEHLVHLLNLNQLKTMSLVFVIIDVFDLMDLEGPENLECINIGLQGDDMSKEEFDFAVLTVLPVLKGLKRLRIFCRDKKSLRNLIREIFADQPGHQHTELIQCGKWLIDFQVFEIGADLGLDLDKDESD